MRNAKRFFKRYSWIITLTLIASLIVIMFIQHSEFIQLKNEVKEIKGQTAKTGMAIADKLKTVIRSESLGKFRISYYCKCSTCCGKWSSSPTKSGAVPKINHTIAVDPDVIPLGSTVIIAGKEYVAEDTGSAIKGNRIDIFVYSHAEAIRLGINHLEVYLKRLGHVNEY